MAPKKGDKKDGKKKKGDGKKDSNEDEQAEGKLMEIDKAFYELQIANLKKRIEKLRADNVQISKDHSDMRKQYEQLETDRADIIAFLKLSLQTRTDEVQELQDRLRAMQQERAEEVARYETRITTMQDEFKAIQDQLKSEITIYAGKLNSLEEFRQERENLMQKFDDQEREKNSMEAALRQRIENAERKMIEDKHRLKRDVDRHLAQLRVEFEATYDLRMDATVKRLIRENIATNKEYNDLILELQKLEKRLKDSREKEQLYRCKCKNAEDAHRLLVEKYTLQIDIIKKLTMEYRAMKRQQQETGTMRNELITQEQQIQQLRDENKRLAQTLEHFEQTSKTMADMEKSLILQARERDLEVETLKTTVHECAKIIQKGLGLRHDDPIERCITRDELLNTLLQILNMAEIYPLQTGSNALEMKEIYKKGDLGFVPPSDYGKSIQRRQSGNKTVELQQATSAKDFLEVVKTTVGKRRPFSSVRPQRQLKSAPVVRKEATVSETIEDDIDRGATQHKLDIYVRDEEHDIQRDDPSDADSIFSSNVSNGDEEISTP